MLSALEKGAEWSKALSWLAQLQLHRVGADEISYNASLSACGQAMEDTFERAISAVVVPGQRFYPWQCGQLRSKDLYPPIVGQ